MYMYMYQGMCTVYLVCKISRYIEKYVPGSTGQQFITSDLVRHQAIIVYVQTSTDLTIVHVYSHENDTEVLQITCNTHGHVAKSYIMYNKIFNDFTKFSQGNYKYPTVPVTCKLY